MQQQRSSGRNRKQAKHHGCSEQRSSKRRPHLLDDKNGAEAFFSQHCVPGRCLSRSRGGGGAGRSVLLQLPLVVVAVGPVDAHGALAAQTRPCGRARRTESRGLAGINHNPPAACCCRSACRAALLQRRFLPSDTSEEPKQDIRSTKEKKPRRRTGRCFCAAVSRRCPSRKGTAGSGGSMGANLGI